MRRATETLTPIYDERMQKTLEGVDKELIARGFFGQLPGAALTGARAADVERAKAAAIAALGGQMQSQSEEQALAQQKMAAEWAINQSDLWRQMQQQRQSGLGNLLNLSLYYPLDYANITGVMPGGALTPRMQAGLAQGGAQQYGTAGAAPGLNLGSLASLSSPSYGLPSVPSGFNAGRLTLNQYTNPWG